MTEAPRDEASSGPEATSAQVDSATDLGRSGSAGEAPSNRWLRTSLGRIAVMLAPPACLGTLLPLLGGWWFADLFSHFRVQYGLVLLAALLASRGYPRRMAVFGSLLFVNAVAILGLFFGPSRVPPSDDDTTILAANLLSGNQDSDAVLALIAAEDPDVIALLEYTPRWQRDLISLRTAYPQGMEDPRMDNFGIAVLSRQPLVGEIVVFGNSGLPTVDVVLPNDIRLIATHPPPPTGSVPAESRDLQLAELAEETATDGRVVLIGDLNATGFSRPFRELLRRGQVRSAGRGWNPTWPDGFPPLWIALDHALVGPTMEVVDFSVGPSIGSDHRPITVRVR